MKLEGFLTLGKSSKGIIWLLLAWENASVDVTGELRLIVAVSIDASIETVGEEEEAWAAGVTKVGDVVAAEIK